MDLEGKKFYNILNGLKIEAITKELIDILVANEIIIKEDIQNDIEVSRFKYSNEYLNYLDENSTDLAGIIRFNKVQYKINDDIIEEIYSCIEEMVNQTIGELSWDESEIEIELCGIIQNDEKLKYLNEKHFSIITEVKKEPEFLVFIEKKEFQGYSTWKEMLCDFLRSHDDLIINYLTNESAFSFNNIEIYTDWVKYYRVKVLSDFCIEKVNEIQSQEKSNKTKEPPSLTDLIFTEDGLDIFNHINSQYSGKKNRAFYSYLYFYLQSKSKLVDNFRKDSIDYRSYLMENFLIGNFPKIITSEAIKQMEKIKKFTIFDNLMKSYSVYSEGK